MPSGIEQVVGDDGVEHAHAALVEHAHDALLGQHVGGDVGGDLLEPRGDGQRGEVGDVALVMGDAPPASQVLSPALK